MKDLFNKLGLWITNGTNPGFTTGEAVILGLSIMTPIFLIMLAPFLIWLALPSALQNSDKYYWLQNMGWIWPLCIFGLGFIGVIGIMIYSGVTGKDL